MTRSPLIFFEKIETKLLKQLKGGKMLRKRREVSEGFLCSKIL